MKLISADTIPIKVRVDDEPWDGYKIIKLAHLRDVIDGIDKGEITMSKGAEILNQVAVDYYKEKTKMSTITNNSIG